MCAYPTQGRKLSPGSSIPQNHGNFVTCKLRVFTIRDSIISSHASQRFPRPLPSSSLVEASTITMPEKCLSPPHTCSRRSHWPMPQLIRGSNCLRRSDDLFFGHENAAVLDDSGVPRMEETSTLYHAVLSIHHPLRHRSPYV